MVAQSPRSSARDPHGPAPSRPLARRLFDLLVADGREPRERARLVELMVRLVELPPPPDPLGIFFDYERLLGRFLDAAHGCDPDALEDRFAELYCHLHGHEAPYTPEERSLMDATGGYWCHAGGLSPILKAGDYIGRSTVSEDLGAGNGLQGLLLQLLYPHEKTVQVELSSRMVQCGQQLQRWLGVAPDRVEWRVSDVRDVSLRGVDFLYLYRPLRPLGAGAAFYRKLAEHIGAPHGPKVIFSVADCLAPLLPEDFSVRYHDGHLTCFERVAR